MCYADLARAATYTEPDDHDPSALRLLVSDFDVELKAVLFDPQQPFLLPAGYATALNTQTLVSLYRLNPSSVIESVFALLLRSDTHEKQKAAALEAVLVLFREGQLLPWTPSPTALLSTVARPLRQLFLVCTSPSRCA